MNGDPNHGVIEADSAEHEDISTSSNSIVVGSDDENENENEETLQDKNFVTNPGLNTTSHEAEGHNKIEQHATKVAKCWEAIRQLIGEKVEVGSAGTVVTWTVVDNFDVPASNAPSDRPNIGLKKDDSWEDCPLNEKYGRIFLSLLWFPMEEQLRRLNQHINTHNNTLRTNEKKVKQFLYSEIITAYALFIGAAGFAEKGVELFNLENETGSIFAPASFDRWMKCYRFKQWKHFIVKVNEDEDKKRGRCLVEVYKCSQQLQ